MKKTIITTLIISSAVAANDFDIKAGFVGLNSNYTENGVLTLEHKSNYEVSGLDLSLEYNIKKQDEISYIIGGTANKLSGKMSYTSGGISQNKIDYESIDYNLYLKGKTTYQTFDFYAKIGTGYKNQKFKRLIENEQEIPYIFLGFGGKKEIYKDILLGADIELIRGYNVYDKIKVSSIGGIDVNTNSENYTAYSLNIPLIYKIQENLSISFENKIEKTKKGKSEEIAISPDLYRNESSMTNIYTKIALNYNF